NSPAINTGSNAAIPAGITTDIEGSVRLQGGTVDMGAYEKLACPSFTKIYVDSSIAVSGNGGSWATAYKHLSSALEAADQCAGIDTILVAKGTYYPAGVQYDTDRDKTFLIARGGLKVYGGFPSGGGSFAQRTLSATGGTN